MDVPTVIEQAPTLRERFDSVRENLQVKWFMMDAQQKQVLLLAGLYLGYTLLDVAGAIAKARIGGEA